MIQDIAFEGPYSKNYKYLINIFFGMYFHIQKYTCKSIKLSSKKTTFISFKIKGKITIEAFKKVNKTLILLIASVFINNFRTYSKTKFYILRCFK